jgi:hypothetical protein
MLGDFMNYVTLFDFRYMPQGLALHASMEKHLKEYCLWILCLDLAVFNAIELMQLPNVKLLKLSDFETQELLELKTQRTVGEYCWTLTPFAPKFVFMVDSNVSLVTYVDADLWFRRDQ